MTVITVLRYRIIPTTINKVMENQMEQTKQEEHSNQELPRIRIQLGTHAAGLTVYTMDIEVAAHTIGECMSSVMFLNEKFNFFSKKNKAKSDESSWGINTG